MEWEDKQDVDDDDVEERSSMLFEGLEEWKKILGRRSGWMVGMSDAVNCVSRRLCLFSLYIKVTFGFYCNFLLCWSCIWLYIYMAGAQQTELSEPDGKWVDFVVLEKSVCELQKRFL